MLLLPFTTRMATDTPKSVSGLSVFLSAANKKNGLVGFLSVFKIEKLKLVVNKNAEENAGMVKKGLGVVQTCPKEPES